MFVDLETWRYSNIIKTNIILYKYIITIVNIFVPPYSRLIVFEIKLYFDVMLQKYISNVQYVGKFMEGLFNDLIFLCKQ
jgi:hypothetical protein